MDSLEIIANAEKVVEDIRDYSRSLKELWQRIPTLALEADGRSGFSDNYSRAYHGGFWALGESIEGGNYTIYVDLATGELVDAYAASGSFSIRDVDVPKKSVLEPAKDKYVLRLAVNLDGLDAGNIIASLEEEIKKPCSQFYDPKEQEEWRTNTKAKLGLTEFYVR